MHAGKVQDRQQLASTVQSVLTSAASKGMQTVAMPLIGTGQAGWPKKLAAQVCLAVVSTFVNASPGSVKVMHIWVSAHTALNSGQNSRFQTQHFTENSAAVD